MLLLLPTLIKFFKTTKSSCEIKLNFWPFDPLKKTSI